MRSRVWLVHLINGLVHRERLDEEPLSEFEPWLDGQCKARGYATGMPVALTLESLDELGPIPPELKPLLHHVGHQIEMAHLLLQPERPRIDLEHSLRILAVVALSHRLENLGVELVRASHCEHRSWTRSLNSIAADVGKRILAEKVSGEDRIAGLPFHNLCVLSELRMCARVARLVARNGNAPMDLRELHRVEGTGRGIVYRAISASIALVAIDGEIDRNENRVINLLMASAHLDSNEKRMFKAEFDKPDGIAELAAGQTCPWETHFLIKHLLIVSYLNGRLDSDELDFVEQLSQSMGVEEDDYRRTAHEAMGLISSGAVSLAPNGGEALWEQVRKTMVRRVERIIRANADNIWGEVKDTGELATLLTRSTRRPLSDEERQKVREQLVDIARSIPALAIFAAPGGGLLLPLIIKHLPIELRPSHFIDEASFTERPMPEEPD